MGNTNQKDIKDDKKSTSSVLNLSLGSFLNDSSSSNSNNNNELMNADILPIDYNENLEWQEFLLEGKEEEIKQKLFIEEDKTHNYFKKKRKTYNPSKMLIKKAPKPPLKIPDEIISPLKLNVKNYGIVPKWNKKPNAILYDYQQNLNDCKSCNDEEDNEFFLSNLETDRTTPNLEDLQNLLNFRKIMSTFRNTINDRPIKEYENILNSDYIFVNKNVNSTKHHKKNKNWHKYIKQQHIKSSDKNLSYKLSRLSNLDEDDLKRSETINPEQTKDHGLFILGILESAANERKGRNTVNV